MATRSPISAPSTKIALPSTRAMPRPSWSRAVMTTGSMPCSLRARRRAGADCTGCGARRAPRHGRIARMRILALDASTEMCTVALGGDDGFVERNVMRRSAPLRAAAADGAGDARRGGRRPQRARRHRLRGGSRVLHRIAHRVRRRAGAGAGCRPARHRRPDAGGDGGRRRARAMAASASMPRWTRACAKSMSRPTNTTERRGATGWIPPCVAPEAAPLPPGTGWFGVGPGFDAYPALRERLGVALSRCDASIAPAASADRRAGAAALRRRRRRAARRRGTAVRAPSRRVDDGRARGGSRFCECHACCRDCSPRRRSCGGRCANAISRPLRRSRPRRISRRGRQGNFRDALAAGYGATVGEADGSDRRLRRADARARRSATAQSDRGRMLRRRGIGRALLRRFLADAAALGADQCFLEVRVSNIAAIGLYSAEGFVPVARRAGYYPAARTGDAREDALVLAPRAARR